VWLWANILKQAELSFQPTSAVLATMKLYIDHLYSPHRSLGALIDHLELSLS
jgi:hypothetical protein